MWGVKQILLMIVALVGCGKDEPAPTALSLPKTSVEAKKPQPPEAVPEKLIAETRRFGGSKSEISE